MRSRRKAAATRVAELREDRLHPVHRPHEAILRLANAEAAAKEAEKLALAEYERAAAAHEDSADAHERVSETGGGLQCR